MGHWSMHIEGAGIHDNGHPDDADALLRDFAEKLAQHHAVSSATFTVGSARELVHPAALDEADPAHAPAAEPHKRAYRAKSH